MRFGEVTWEDTSHFSSHSSASKRKLQRRHRNPGPPLSVDPGVPFPLELLHQDRGGRMILTPHGHEMSRPSTGALSRSAGGGGSAGRTLSGLCYWASLCWFLWAFRCSPEVCSVLLAGPPPAPGLRPPLRCWSLVSLGDLPLSAPRVQAPHPACPPPPLLSCAAHWGSYPGRRRPAPRTPACLAPCHAFQMQDLSSEQVPLLDSSFLLPVLSSFFQGDRDNRLIAMNSGSSVSLLPRRTASTNSPPCNIRPLSVACSAVPGQSVIWCFYLSGVTLVLLCLCFLVTTRLRCHWSAVD